MPTTLDLYQVDAFTDRPFAGNPAAVCFLDGLRETGRLGAGETASFHTLSGLLTAERRGEWIELDFPARRVEPAEPPPTLLAALGAAPVYVGKSRYDYFLELPDEDAVRATRPDFQALRSLPVRGIIV